MKCNNCGADVPDNSKFCLNCGNEVEENALINENTDCTPKHITGNTYFTPVSINNDTDCLSGNISKKSKLFGFRSNKLWKKCLAVIYFVFMLIVLIGIIFVKDELDVTAMDKVLSKISYICLFLSLLLPYLWLSDIFSLKTKAAKNKRGISFMIAAVLFIVPLIGVGCADSAKSDEYQAAYSQKQQEEKTTESVSTTQAESETEKATETTTEIETEPTTADSLHDNIVDDNEEIFLMMMSEDIAKALSNYPSSVKIKTNSWTFEQNDLKYTTCCTFNCSNAYGVNETHILVVISEANADGTKINPIEVCVDGETVNIN